MLGVPSTSRPRVNNPFIATTRNTSLQPPSRPPGTNDSSFQQRVPKQECMPQGGIETHGAADAFDSGAAGGFNDDMWDAGGDQALVGDMHGGGSGGMDEAEGDPLGRTGERSCVCVSAFP
jgi:hypothetical protein